MHGVSFWFVVDERENGNLSYLVGWGCDGAHARVREGDGSRGDAEDAEGVRGISGRLREGADIFEEQRQDFTKVRVQFIV
jgi:hypothetical protein